jgi:hypothetical protein
MNFDVNELNALYEQGYTLEDIVKMAQDQVLAAEQERRKAEEKARAQKEFEERELLKREARTYLINGLLCYCEALGVFTKGSDEEYTFAAQMFENYLIAIEPILPLMVHGQLNTQEAMEMAETAVDEAHDKAMNGLMKELGVEEVEVGNFEELLGALAEQLGIEIEVEELDENEEK